MDDDIEYRSKIAPLSVHTKLLYSGNSMIYSIHYYNDSFVVKYMPIDEEPNKYMDVIKDSYGRKVLSTNRRMTGIPEAVFSNEVIIQKHVHSLLPNITSRIFYHSILNIIPERNGSIHQSITDIHKFLRNHFISRNNGVEGPYRIGIIAMELMTTTTMKEYLGIQSPTDIISILEGKHKEVAKSILSKYFYSLILLTSIGVIHGDPQFSNALVDPNTSSIYIIDFGRSKFMNIDQKTRFNELYEIFRNDATLENLTLMARYMYDLNNEIFVLFEPTPIYMWMTDPTILNLIYPHVVLTNAGYKRRRQKRKRTNKRKSRNAFVLFKKGTNRYKK